MGVLSYFRNLLFGKKVEGGVKSKPKVSLRAVVKRADGSIEIYEADEKGQRRIQ